MAVLVATSAFAQILPGEQAPPANPGQRNFGGFQRPNRDRDTTGMAAMMRARMAEMNRVRTLSFDELSILEGEPAHQAADVNQADGIGQHRDEENGNNHGLALLSKVLIKDRRIRPAGG